MCNVTNKQIADLLKKSVSQLATGKAFSEVTYYGNDHRKDQYICLAVDTVSDDSEVEVNEAIRCIIRERIPGCHSVYEYLHRYHNIPKKDLTFKNLQTYRHAWLQELIKEFDNA